MKKSVLLICLVAAAGLLALTGCEILDRTPEVSQLSASGTITTRVVQVGPEIGGRLLEVMVDKGAAVKQGDLLFKLDDQILQAQLSQADAAVKVAQSNLDIARQKLASAESQYDLALQSARLQFSREHSDAWKLTQSDKINLPVWYFQKSEQIAALQAEAASAQKNLDAEQANLTNELTKASNASFVGAERRLAAAQQAYAISEQVLAQAKAAKVTKDLVDAAQKSADAASSELDAAQKAYDQMLTSDSAARVREARARLAVAQERLYITQDRLDALLTGDQSLQVQAARLTVDQAKSAVAQAEASLAQAEAAQRLIKVQIAKMVVISPLAGTVLSRPLNPGEVAGAGATVVEIGQLDPLTLTVYVAESLYGQIDLGQKATVTVDSFPGRSFIGKVTYISDEAEFTPRNVQTTESRSATVYKVEITLSNPGGELKPGMPADVVFD